MAYVGTPRRYNDPVMGLASVLQGEASSAAGQRAVANVIQNRADANYSGYGGDIASQAFAPRQFQGQSTPSAQAIGIAQQAYDGTLPRELSGSLNYAAPVFSGPGATTAGWAKRALASGEGVNIGGNVFFTNDRGGTPSYTPGASALATNGSETGVNTPGQTSGIVTDPNPKINADGTAEATWTEGEMTANEAPNSPLGVIRIRPQNAPPATGGNAGTGNGGASGGSSAGGSFTVPQAIDTQTRGNASDTASLNSTSRSNTADLNKTAKENTEALNKTSTANTKSATDKAQGLYDAATGSLSDYFVRLVFIVVGLIALAAALMMFKPTRDAVASVVPAGRALKGLKAAI